MPKNRILPRIKDKVDYGTKKQAILAHLRHLPDNLKPYFQRPRWDVNLEQLNGTSGHSIQYFPPNRYYIVGKAKWEAQTKVILTFTDSGDRDVYHRCKHARFVE